MGWIKKACEIKMQDVCKVPFFIGKLYQDEVQCDVVEMDACQLLLRRPQQYDVEVIHKGKLNAYIFVQKGPTIEIDQCKERKTKK